MKPWKAARPRVTKRRLARRGHQTLQGHREERRARRGVEKAWWTHKDGPPGGWGPCQAGEWAQTRYPRGCGYGPSKGGPVEQGLEAGKLGGAAGTVRGGVGGLTLPRSQEAPPTLSVLLRTTLSSEAGPASPSLRAAPWTTALRRVHAGLPSFPFATLSIF